MLSESAGRDKYTAGGVLVNGNIAHGGSQSNTNPGPGHYNVQTPDTIFRAGASFSPQNANASATTTGGMRSTSSRMLLPSASLKDGVLFHGKVDEHSHIGPGHYHNSEQNNLLKRSFNARVTSPRSPRSPRGRSSPGSDYGNSPSHYGGGGAGGQFDEAHAHGHGHEDSQDFYHRSEQGHESYTPVQAHHEQTQQPASAEKPKSKRKQGRMTIMESMVPSMFRNKA